MAAHPSSGHGRRARIVGLLFAGWAYVSPLLAADARAEVIAGDWTTNGVLAAAGPGDAISAFPVPDESGGFYLVWVARPVGATTTEVRVRRMFSSGTPDQRWPEDGVLLGANSGPVGAWRTPSGEVVVSSGRRVWRLTPWGGHANGWPSDGVLLAPATGASVAVGVDRDGRVWGLGAGGGMICTYPPNHPPYCIEAHQLHAVRLNSGGGYDPGWAPPGKIVYGEDAYSAPEPGPFLAAIPDGVAFVYLLRSYRSQEILIGIRVGYVGEAGTAQVSAVDSEYGGFINLSRVRWDVDDTGAIFANTGMSTLRSSVGKHSPLPQWPWPGWKFPGTYNYGETRSVVPDGAGGTYVHSMLYRGDGQGFRHYIHHVLSNGSADPRWPVDGVELSDAAEGAAATYISARDARGGYFAAWPQFSGAHTDIQALRLLPDCTSPPGWSVSGVAVCALAGSSQSNPAAAPDAAANMFVVWLDDRNGPVQVFAQKLGFDSPVSAAVASALAERSGEGVLLSWQVAGAGVLTVERSTDAVAWEPLGAPLASDAADGLSFTDGRPVRGQVNRYRLREPASGWTGGDVSLYVPAVVAVTGLAVTPNPIEAGTRIRFAARGAASVAFTVVDLQGRVLAQRAEAAPDGGGDFEWAGLSRLPRGLYWVRMHLPSGESRTARFVVAR